jgi:diguanylate cyclase (GGDEF)-like protein/PAS domain S-box-containing protein
MQSLLRIKRRIWALAVAVITVVVTFTYLSGRRYVSAVESVQHTLAVTSAIDDLTAAVIDQETGQRGFLLTSDPTFLDSYNSGRYQVNEQLRQLNELLRDDPEQQSAFETLRVEILAKQQFVDSVLALAQRGSGNQALQIVRTGRGKQLMDQIRKQSALMTLAERNKLSERSGFALRTQGYAFAALVAGALVTALLLIGGFVSLHRDAAELRRAAEDLAESEERFRMLADSASDIVRVFELDGSLWYQSPSIERLLGFTIDEISELGEEILHPDDVAENRSLLRKMATGELDGGMLVHRFLCEDGNYRWFETQFAMMVGHPPRIQATARDVTQRRRDTEALVMRADEMKTLSLRDELTGLYNRRGFFELAEQAERVVARERRSLAVVFIDMDGLKPINDLFGHDAGDQAIIETAKLLQSVCRASDVLSRLGGDEFAVLAINLDPTSFNAFRARTELALAARNARADLPFELSFSLGAAFRATDHDEPFETLVARADAAMYAQKRARRAERGLRTSLVPGPRAGRPQITVVNQRPRVSQRPR